MYTQTRLSKPLEIIGPGQNRFTEQQSLTALASPVNNYDTNTNRNFLSTKISHREREVSYGLRLTIQKIKFVPMHPIETYEE
jgi:hypothetical protein